MKRKQVLAVLGGAVLFFAVLFGIALLIVHWARQRQQLVVALKGMAIELTGEVVNEAGEPIPGALVRNRKSTQDDNADVTQRTGPDGKFAFKRVASGTITLVVSADGYAPQVRQPHADTAGAPIQIILKRGGALHGRAVDTSGKSLGGITVSLMWWSMGADPFEHTTSDAQGRFEFRNVAETDTELEAYGEGYQSIRVEAHPSDKEMVLTLKANNIVTISGAVTDAQTHQPVQKFDVIQGIVWPNSLDNKPDYGYRFAKTFTGGHFKLPLDGYGVEHTGWYLLIQADGYQPVFSELLTASGTRDFALEPAPNIAGHVMNLDGSPAGGAQVVLCHANDDMIFQDGHFYISPKPILTETDGSFHFHPQVGPIDLWAMNDAGMARLHLDSPGGEPIDLKLTPWAKLRIKLRLPASQRPALDVGVNPPNEGVAWRWTYTKTPDAAGELELDRVPPLEGGVAAVMVLRKGRKGSLDGPLEFSADVIPGQTTDIDLTQGATVTGRVTGDDAVAMLQRLPSFPANKWPEDWKSAVKLLPPVIAYRAACDSSGAFRLTGVVPGKYLCTGYSGDNPVADARASVVLDIADKTPAVAVDTGELSPVKAAVLRVGQAMPFVMGRTLDDHPIELSDFTGKYVLLVIYDRDGAFDRAAPVVRGQAAPFAGDKRVALVGISEDCLIKPIPLRPAPIGDGWINGYVSLREEQITDILPRVMEHRPFTFIFGPDGRLLAADIEATQLGKTMSDLLAAGGNKTMVTP